MQGRALTALTAALLGSVALIPETASAAALPTCAQLATLLASNAFITQTGSDNQGIASPQAAIVLATATNAAYCQVQFQYSSKSGPAFGYAPGESQTIGLKIGLPLNSTDQGVPTAPNGFSWTAVNGAWNGKVQNLGGGGNVGTVGSVTSATNYGWVGSSTDGGHNTAQNGTLANWAVIQATHQLDLGEINDFTFESLHQQYVWALYLANQYYGQSATRNYWYGCSTGGRQGLALAEMYGGDFDGIVAGAPAAFNSEFLLAAGWASYLNRDVVVGMGHPAITTAQFDFVNSHAIAACDVEGTDTVADGVIDDPRQCPYSAAADPTVIAAPAGTCTGANCVDTLQAATIDMIWDGPRNHYGTRIWHPYQKGTPEGPGFSIGPAITGNLGPGQAIAWDEKDLTFSSANVYSSRALAAANPLGEPDPIAMEDMMLLGDQPGGVDNYMGIVDAASILTAYSAGPKHPKIVLWHGSADPNIMPGDSIEFYRLVATAYGCHGNSSAPARCMPDFAGLSSWFRYYHAPGVAHCGGGVGASPVLGTLPDGNAQIFDDMVKWVENGIVPQSAGDATHMGILATGPGTFGTRPICPWPTTAIYSGTGSTAVASNYTCGSNLDANDAQVCFGLHTVFGAETSSGTDWKAQGGPPPGQCP
jgi:hypothetical protein